MNYVIRGLQVSLCAVSMVLTGLFALSIGGIVLSDWVLSWLHQSEAPTSVSGQWFTASLFVLIGLCIDLSKFVFWSFRRRYCYRVISVLLMLFSWLASLSYFMAMESASIARTQRLSPAYQALTHQMDAINDKLSVNTQLVEKRLSSQYHKQWALADNLANENKVLKERLTALEAERASLGQTYAKTQVTVTQFFIALSELLGVSEASVRGMSFGLLALLLEVCALASIGLVAPRNRQQESKHVEKERKKSMAKLERDILDGKVAPVIRQILSAKYGLGIQSIQAVLYQLLEAGLIEQDKKNSYRLKAQCSNE